MRIEDVLSLEIDPRQVYSRPVCCPLRSASLLAGVYMVFCAAYIWYSSTLAASLAGSVGQLATIELAKGLVFVAVTAGAFFAIALWLLKRIERGEWQQIRQRYALLAMERRAMAGVFAASVAHDLGNLLNIARVSTDLMATGETQTLDGSPLGDQVRQSLDQMSRLARQMVAVGQVGVNGEREELDLAQVVLQTLELARLHSRAKTSDITCAGETSLLIRGYGALLSQMLLNLVINAADAVQGQGHIEVHALRDDGNAVLEVHDDGPGVPLERRAQIFDAFFTSKDFGTGLGLLSVKAAATLHGGRVAVTDSPLGGACFRVSFPIGKVELNAAA